MYGYVNYRISVLPGRGKQQLNLEKVNMLDLIGKSYFNESCIYGLEGDLSYFQGVPYKKVSKSQKTVIHF